MPIDYDLLTEYGDTRITRDAEGEAASIYIYKMLALNNKGLKHIAKYYNKKYSVKNEYESKSIYVPDNNTDSVQKLKECILDDSNIEKKVYYGTMVFSNNPDGHPTPVVFEQFKNPKTGQIERGLFISDSVGSSANTYYIKSLYSELVGQINQELMEKGDYSFVSIYPSIIGARQASNGPCKSECITYLKNGMQKESFSSNFTFFMNKKTVDGHTATLRASGSPEKTVSGFESDYEKLSKGGYTCFMEDADMLKSSETSDPYRRTLIPPDVHLETTKAGKTVAQKKGEYKTSFMWKKTMDFGAGVGDTTKAFHSAGSNMTKVYKHMALCIDEQNQSTVKILSDISENFPKDYPEMHKLFVESMAGHIETLCELYKIVTAEEFNGTKVPTRVAKDISEAIKHFTKEFNDIVDICLGNDQCPNTEAIVSIQTRVVDNNLVQALGSLQKRRPKL